jgi:hypothetical protein
MARAMLDLGDMRAAMHGLQFLPGVRFPVRHERDWLLLGVLTMVVIAVVGTVFSHFAALFEDCRGSCEELVRQQLAPGRAR